MHSYHEIIRPLLSWYEGERRPLPWREDPTPYHIWVSEIMLQQTRIEAVKGYYARFLTALPTIQDLAEADDETILKLWEGLGYYNRVRNMKKAAQTVVSEFGGELPGTYEELLSLPGIGSYTAGAIASIGFGESVPCVDGNVLRVLMRVTGSSQDIAKDAVKKEVWQDLKEAMEGNLPAGKAGAFNEALMELGEVVCIPNGEPLCEKCPLAEFCMARTEERQRELPVKSAKKARRVAERTVFLIRKDGLLALQKRPEEGLLAGLWELPGVEKHLSEEEAKIWLAQQGFAILRIRRTADAKHIFSHVEWRMRGYAAEVEGAGDKKYAWTSAEDREKGYALPSAFDGFYSEMRKESFIQTK